MRFSLSNVAAIVVMIAVASVVAQEKPAEKSYYLIGNSLTWDTVPPKFDGDVQWHVGCGKTLPFLFQNPAEPCVKTSTLWPTALKEKQYDMISVQPHYGSTVEEDATVISEWMKLQPAAVFVIHTGWAFSETRAAEWSADEKPAAKMTHNVAYFDALIDLLKKTNPDREIRRTKASDLLAKVDSDIKAGKAPIQDVAELYRDKIHMDLVTGRYLMHNAMRHALGQPRSQAGFEKLTPKIKTYLDSVLDALD